MWNIRCIKEEDDRKLAKIIRENLEKYDLALPGTIYFDPDLDHLSQLYTKEDSKKRYFVIEDENSKVLGGVGLDCYLGFLDCCEIQKLYVSDEAKGKGYGKALMEAIEREANLLGFKRIYLETHSNLQIAVSMYEKMGYHKIDPPNQIQHSTMDLFYLKEL